VWVLDPPLQRQKQYRVAAAGKISGARQRASALVAGN
jgi:hypothetical protein